MRNYFLKQFGRPVRASACECERNAEPNIAQVLHLLNSDFIDSRLRHDDGRIARWVRSKLSDEKILEEMYLTFLSRPIGADEKKLALGYLAKAKNRQAGFEDVAWALLNTKEFLFNH